VRHLVWIVRAGALAIALLLARPTSAEPQGHLALRAAPCGIGNEGKLWESTRFCGGFAGDLLLFRKRNRDVGLGPYVEVLTAGFWDARFGGGASLLLPVTDSFPLVVSVGAFDHELRAAAVGATLFWGNRSYNFDSVYNYSLGIYASVYRDLDAEGATLVSLGVELDTFFLVAPFLFAFQAVR
jgi:hypothetical protein